MSELLSHDDEHEHKHAHVLPPDAAAGAEPVDPELLNWFREKDTVDFIVVPHSHLDYAWYRDRESSKMREIEAFVKTIKVDNFTLEQTITIKEFIEGGGERVKEDLLEMIRSGKMELIGMHTQPDVFLSPQELEFWNFEFGEKIARKLGGVPPRIKYLPDSFGEHENTPMVAKHAGMEAIMSMRGFQHDWPVFIWESPDGSRVPTFMIPGGYANAGHLTDPGVRRSSVSPERFYEMQVDAATLAVRGLMNKFGHRYKQIDFPHMLLMNGNDFTKPDADLPEVLEGVQEKIRTELGIKNFKIRSSSLGKYVDLALNTIDESKMQTYRGEMRSGKDHYVLRGIDSARMYLKQQMHQVETRIYDAGALSALFLLADKANLIKKNEIEDEDEDDGHQLWQQVLGYLRATELILPVGSHDTISGCGSDDAYPLPLSLMTGSYNAADQTARNSISALAGRVDTYGAFQHKEHDQTFANLLPYDRTVLVEVPMQGDLEHDRGLKVVAIYGDGRVAEYPAQIIQRPKSRYAICALPMTGMSSVQVRLEATDGAPFEKVTPETSFFETDIYSLDVLPNGTVCITDKRTGSVAKGLIFEEQGDRGDEYTFCPADNDIVRTTSDSEAVVNIINDGPVFTDIEISTQLVVPDGLEGVEGTARAARARSQNMVTVPITTRARLFKNADIDRIEFSTTIDNKARDHRMRVLFDTPNATDTVRAKEPYGMTTRSAVPIPGGEGWMEPLPVATSHNQGLVTAGDLALFNRGLPEYEAVADDSGTINQVALTLLRGVGYLSRGDQGSELQTRPGWAGPGYATPDAQMIGKHTFEYAINLGGQQRAGDVIAQAKDYMHHAEHGFAGANINDLFTVKMSHKVEMSTLRPTADGEAVFVRFSNPEGESAMITLGGKFPTAVESNYDGTLPEQSVDMSEFELKPYSMVTVRLG